MTKKRIQKFFLIYFCNKNNHKEGGVMIFRRVCMYILIICMGFVSSLHAISPHVTVTQGWNLLGAFSKFDPRQLTCANVVWTYKNNTWSLFGANITNANNYGQPKLEELNPGEGYWVYTSTTGCTSFITDIVAPDNNFTTTINSNYFVDNFINVPFDEIVNRSFKYVPSSSSLRAAVQTDYQMVTFDSNGVAAIIAPSCNPDENATVIHLKIENSFLNFYTNGVYVKSYKILSVDSNIGLVLGEVNQNTSYNTSHPGSVFALLNAGVIKTPINMGNNLPYSLYSLSEGDETYTRFDCNGTYASYLLGNGSSVGSGTFSINQDGALYAQMQDIDHNLSMESIVQTTNSIGRYNISDTTMTRNFVSHELSYVSSGSTVIAVNLADNNVSNWNQFFSITNNRLDDERYDSGSIYPLDNNVSLGTYEISNDGKTMTTHYISTCEPKPQQQVFNGNVVSWAIESKKSMITSSSPLTK